MQNWKWHIFWLEIPLSLNRRRANFLASFGKLSLEMLENPSARELMQVVVVAGLAQNLQPYALWPPTGIQDGHMKCILTTSWISLMQLMANGFWYVNILRSMLFPTAVVELIENIRK
jgi:hydroxymethylglutaryl-CoA reductase